MARGPSTTGPPESPPGMPRTACAVHKDRVSWCQMPGALSYTHKAPAEAGYTAGTAPSAPLPAEPPGHKKHPEPLEIFHMASQKQV